MTAACGELAQEARWEDRGEVEEAEENQGAGSRGFGQWSYDCSRAQALKNEKACETKGTRAQAEGEAENHHFRVVEMMVAEIG